MAEKISMIIVVVDLDCHKCYNKIRKILCQLQDCERIRTISFDDKSKTITIVGPFDPHRLACKLRCKGGKVIRDIHIVDSGGGKPPPQKMAEASPPSPAPAKNGKPPKHKEKPPAAEPPPPPTPPPEPAPAPPPDMPPPSPAHQAPPDREMSAMVPAFVEEKQPRAKPAELEPPPMSPPRKERPMDFPSPMPASLPPPRQPCRPLEQAPVEYVIPTVEIPSWPAPPAGPCGCPCCAPCYQGYYEGCRCCCCGRMYAQPLPAPAGCGYRGCRTFSDEDPTAACSIM
ncbi:hypothetical protein GQ55_8G235200 [Panicum hallii var. hallii]|uniref:HMA domain-containing protein n=1 Tax=Panicum hallii var. hallii TaxID=1504633 RepID=A0A2T7CQN3_9POAL|nr:hypothetical protein GQ55_8G235200 [Panicum hallii var. hallii]